MKPLQVAWRAILCAFLLSAPFAVVQAEEAEIEEIVVTGSHIRGTPTDAELPVDVMSAVFSKRGITS